MFLDLEAYDRFRMSKEELELAEANKDEKEKKADEKEEKKKENKKKKEEKTGKIEVDKVKPLELDFENCATVWSVLPSTHPIWVMPSSTARERRFITRLPLKVATTSGVTT